MLARIFKVSAAAAMLAVPVQASAAGFDAGETRVGTFAGAQFKLSLGGGAPAKPRASLGIAPVGGRQSTTGLNRTIIGEGLALSVSGNSKPKLTLGGIPAGRALGLAQSGPVDPKNKLGLSTGAWVGISVVAVVAAVGTTALLFAKHCEDRESSLCGDSE